MRHLLAVPLIACATAAPAQDFLAGTLEDALSGEGRTVQVDGFAGALSSVATVEQITIADADGVWLTLRDVELDWTRTALLQGRVEVRHLRAGEIRIPRAPLPADGTPSAEATGFSLPELPVAIKIGEVSAKRVTIGEGLFGIPVEFSLDGALSLEDGEGQGNIVATRIDGTQGAFTVEGSFNNATSVLDITALVAEAEDGIIATLAGLPGAPSIRLEAGGEGPLADFDAALKLATDGEDRVTGNLGVSQGSGFRVDLQGDVAPLFLPEYREFFGDDVSLTAQGTQRPDGSLSLSDLSLAAAQMVLEGDVVIGAEGVPTFIDLDGTIAPTDGDPVTLPVAGTPLRIDAATLDIAFDADEGEDWQGAITVVGLDRGGVGADELRLTGTGQIVAGDAPSVSAALDFAATAVNLGDPDAQAALGEEVTGSTQITWAEGEPVRIADLTLRGDTFGVAGNVSLAPDDSGLTILAEVSADIQNLANFSGLAERPLTGSLRADLTAQAQPVAGTFAATLAGNGAGLSVGTAEVDRLLAGNVGLDITLRRTEEGTFLDRIATQSGAATVQGSGALQTGGGSVDLTATLRDTGIIANGLPGPLRLTAEATGADNLWTIDVGLEGDALAGGFDGSADLTGDAPVIDGTANLRAGDVAPFGARLGRDIAGAVNLTASGSVATDLSAFDARVRGMVTDLVTGVAQADPLLAGAVTVDVSALREATGITLRDFSIAGPQIGATGTARYFDDGSASADVDARLPEPGVIAPGLPGPLTADVTLAGGPEAWDVQGTIAGPGTNVGADVTVSADRALGTVSLRAADLAPFSDLAQRQLAGAVEARAEGEVAFDLTTFDLTASGTSTDLQVGVPQVRPILAGTATFAVAAETEGDVIAVETFRFESPMLAGRAAGRLAPDLSRFEIDASAEGTNLRLGIPAMDDLTRGRSTATVQVTGADGAIEISSLALNTSAVTATARGSLGESGSSVTFDARLDNLARFVAGFPGVVSARGTVSQPAGNSDYSINISASGPGGIAADVSGQAAPDASTVNLGITGNAPLELANRFIAPRAVSGQAAFNLRVAGPPALSSVSGTVSTSGGRFSAPTLGAALSDLAANIALSGGSASIDASAAVVGGGGLQANGRLGLSGPFPADLGVTLSSVRLQDAELYDTSVDGEIRVAGPLTGGARISGGLTLNETELRIPSTGLTGVGDIPDLQHVGEPAAVRATRARAGLLSSGSSSSSGGGGAAYPLDLTINAPSQIFLRGRGLDAELGGSLRLLGSTAQIIPSGAFQLIRGRLDILGQRLDLTEGRVTLQGDFDPFVRLVATTETSDTKISIVVEGVASSPEVLFLSDPDLPQDEVVSRLLFDRGLDNLSPLQAAQLASAVATLAGRGGGGILANLRQNFGLDDLDVTSDEEGGTAVRAGKYISDNVYTDVTVGSEGEANVSINLDLTPSVTVKGTAGSDGRTGIGVFFERDY
ncbi:MAG: translocation/assembly module TamB domain-containing protein [Pseudomonadota bacterium]